MQSLAVTRLNICQKAGLIPWLAGNQFFAMNDVVRAFQKPLPGTSVGLITLPPGLLLQAIKAGGWIYDGKEYLGRPGHLCQIRICQSRRKGSDVEVDKPGFTRVKMLVSAAWTPRAQLIEPDGTIETQNRCVLEGRKIALDQSSYSRSVALFKLTDAEV